MLDEANISQCYNTPPVKACMDGFFLKLKTANKPHIRPDQLYIEMGVDAFIGI